METIYEPTKGAGRFPTFGDALKYFRERMNMSQDAFAQMFIPTITGQAISFWETNVNIPVKDLYEQILDFIPEMKEQPRPEVQNIPKPDGGRGQPKDGSGNRTNPPTQTGSVVDPALAERKVTDPKAEHLRQVEMAGLVYARAMHGVTEATKRVNYLDAEMKLAGQQLERKINECKTAHVMLIELTGARDAFKNHKIM